MTKARPPNNENWPKNGSILKGVAHQVGKEKWLHCTEIKQSGTSTFLPLAEGYWMPFDYSGPLLRTDL